MPRKPEVYASYVLTGHRRPESRNQGIVSTPKGSGRDGSRLLFGHDGPVQRHEVVYVSVTLLSRLRAHFRFAGYTNTHIKTLVRLLLPIRTNHSTLTFSPARSFGFYDTLDAKTKPFKNPYLFVDMNSPSAIEGRRPCLRRRAPCVRSLGGGGGVPKMHLG